MRAAVIAAAVAVLGAAPAPPAPARWVTDGVGFLSPATRDQLDRRLESYQRATGHQIVVWIGDTIGGAALDDWAIHTFERWKVGRKGIDDGVVMFVLAADRAIDIEVGYGLEDRVPDAIASRIIREVMTPRLQAGQHDAAVTAGVEAVLSAIEGRAWPGAERPASGHTSPLSTIAWVLFAIGFVILLVTNPRLALALLWTVAGSRGGGGLGSGGFAGGGGRAGGGGARGRW